MLHPWDDFLRARLRAIDWLRTVMGYERQKILETLNVDEEQLVLLEMTISDKKRDGTW